MKFYDIKYRFGEGSHRIPHYSAAGIIIGCALAVNAVALGLSSFGSNYHFSLAHPEDSPITGHTDHKSSKPSKKGGTNDKTSDQASGVTANSASAPSSVATSPAAAYGGGSDSSGDSSGSVSDSTTTTGGRGGGDSSSGSSGGDTTAPCSCPTDPITDITDPILQTLLEQAP
jgi:hypothetical protein